MNTTPERPTLLFDGECGFCREWISRWNCLTGDLVAFVPFQDAASQFPDIPLEVMRRKMQLVLPSGERFEGAAAAFRLFALVPGHGHWDWMYRSVPGFALISAFVYWLVSTHRPFFSRLSGVRKKNICKRTTKEVH